MIKCKLLNDASNILILCPKEKQKHKDLGKIKSNTFKNEFLMQCMIASIVFSLKTYVGGIGMLTPAPSCHQQNFQVTTSFQFV